MVVSTNPGWIQTAFNILTGIFDQVGLRKNVRRTVGMVFQLCRAVEVRADEAYKHWMTGEGQGYQEMKRERFQCPECRKDLARGSLDFHQENPACRGERGVGQKGNEGDRFDKPRTFSMTFPEKSGPSPCPVEGCSGRAATRSAMRVHFWHWKIWYTMVILE